MQMTALDWSSSRAIAHVPRSRSIVSRSPTGPPGRDAGGIPPGNVRYRMKRTFSDGRSEVVLSPQDFLARLCALIPQPRVHLVRYFGAVGPGARGRAALTGRRREKPALAPTSPDDKPAAPPPPPATTEDPDSLGAPPPDPGRARRLDWASLLQRVYQIDVLVCRDCGGRLRVIAFITDERVARRILDHLGIPPVTRARPGPPKQICGGNPLGPPRALSSPPIPASTRRRPTNRPRP